MIKIRNHVINCLKGRILSKPRYFRFNAKTRRSTPADLKPAFGKSSGQLRLIK